MASPFETAAAQPPQGEGQTFRIATLRCHLLQQIAHQPLSRSSL